MLVSKIKIVFLFLLYSSSLVFSKSSANTWNKIAGLAKKAKTKEEIFLDNTFVQSYKSQLGLWHYVSTSVRLRNFTRKYKTTEKLVRKINDIEPRAQISGWVFVPFSGSFYKVYIKKGISRRKLTVSRADFIWPIEGSRITSRVGKRWGLSHSGLDIAAAKGTIVLAAQFGKVVKISRSRSYGRVVFLEHEESYTTKYAHLSSILVKEDDIVEKGQIIALSGNSGRSTGPHLHFEIDCGGISLDPENFLPEFSNSMELFYDYRADLLKRLEVQN